MDGPTPDHTLLPLSPAGNSGRFESVIKGPTHAPSAKLWNQVSVAPHTQTPLWSDTGRVPAFHLAAPPRVRRWSRRSRLYSVWVPGKSATQLVSLAPVDHLTRLCDSVRPAFSQVPPHSSKGLCGEITVLLARDVMEPVPPADMKTGFYSPYFIVPKKGGGWRPILDLRILNWASFRSRDSRRSASSGASVPEIGLQRLTWRTRTSLSQSFRTTGHSCGLRLKNGHISTRSCPSGCPCHPVSSRKLWRQPLFPREQGIRILNYLDDWLILPQSQDQLCEHRDLVLSHLSQLGLRVNWEKSKLSPTQRISFLGMELDSVNQKARLTQERAQSVLNCLNAFKSRSAVPLKQFQRLLGHMAAAAAVTPLGLLQMRPLQHWLHGRVPRWAW